VREVRRWLSTRLARPEDAAGLVFFRFALGVLMAIEAGRYLGSGWIRAYYFDVAYRFKYMGFEWVEPLPYPAMIVLFALLTVAGLAMAVGIFYRAATLVLLVGHLYVFLLSATHYLNHIYLLLLLLLLMLFVPADRAASIDSRLRPSRARREVPSWARALLAGQVSLVYVFGGIAKLNPDWVAGRPIRQWLVLALREAPWRAEIITAPWFAEVIVWGGIAFDLCIVPLLVWRRTRALAVLASFGFHLTNAYLFNIGVFPWAMLIATTLFFDPSWARRIPKVGPRLSAEIDRGQALPRAASEPRLLERPVAWAMTVWFAVQLFLPLRHHLYPGDVAWTEEGHYFSWRMKLRSKSGTVKFIVTDPSTGERWVLEAADELTRRQAAKMAAKPDLILQYAQVLARRYEAERGGPVEIRADVQVALNYHPPRRLIDPDVDLAKVRPSLAPSDWILRYDDHSEKR
jgi:vitamin K-dependent gamma-carboxylase